MIRWEKFVNTFFFVTFLLTQGVVLLLFSLVSSLLVNDRIKIGQIGWIPNS